MRQDINQVALANYMKGRIITKLIQNIPGLERKVDSIDTGSSINTELFIDNYNINVSNELGLAVKACFESINRRVKVFTSICPALEWDETLYPNFNKYAHLKMIGLEEDEEFEDEEDLEKTAEKLEEDEDSVTSLIGKLMKKITESSSDEIDDIADNIIAISKDEVEGEKEEKKIDGEIFQSEDTGEDKGPDDDSNPFDGDNSDDKDDSSNPFGGDSDNSDDSGDSSGGNPFGGDNGDSSDNNDGDNPFGGSNDNDDSSDNPFGGESIGVSFKELNAKKTKISELSFRGIGIENIMNGNVSINPFNGFENNTITNFAEYVTDKIFGDTLIETNSKFGVESKEFNRVLNNTKSCMKDVYYSTVGAVLFAEMLGPNNININKIKYPTSIGM